MHSERFTELHREEKREEGDRGDWEGKVGVKRRETDLACIQFPKCVLQSQEHPKRFTMLGRKEKGNEEIEVT